MEKITLNDDQEYTLTINYARLYILKKERKTDYERYWSACKEFGEKGGDVIFAALKIVHVAYLCGLIKKTTIREEHPEVRDGAGFEEFMGLTEDYSPIEMLNIAKELISPKKKKASGTHSDEK